MYSRGPFQEVNKKMELNYIVKKVSQSIIVLHLTSLNLYYQNIAIYSIIYMVYGTSKRNERSRAGFSK